MKRARTPTRIQMEAAECGAVALAIVLEYHGHYSGIEPLREAMGVSRDGTSAGQIARTARKYGLEAQGFKAELDALTRLSFPVIVHWEFNHFVVLEGVVGDVYYLNDPAVGPRRVSRAEMDAAFTGVVLVLTPGPAFKRTPAPPSILSLAWRRLLSVRPSLGVSLVASLALVLPNLLVPTFAGIFTDRIVIQSHFEWLWPLLAAMLLFGLTRAWATLQRARQLSRAQMVVATGGSLAFLRHALTLPVSFYYHRFASEVAARVRLNDAVAGTLVQTVTGAVLGLICMLIYGAIMAAYDLDLTLLAVLFAGVSMASLAISQRLLADGHRRVLVEESRLDGLVNRSLAGIEETAAAGTNDLVFERIMGQQSLVLSQRQAVLRNVGVLQALQKMLAMLGLVVVLIQGGYDIMDGAITVGMMVAFQGLMQMFGAPIAQLLSAGAALQDVRGNMERLQDVMSHPADPVFAVAGGMDVARLSSASGFSGERADAGVSTASGAFPASGTPVAAGVATPAGGSATASATASASSSAGASSAVGASSTPVSSPITGARGRIEFQDVSFGYSPGRAPQIEGLNLIIEAGTSVAIVGASGCGKSTLARMLVGQLQPDAGDILLDGESLARMPRARRFAAFAHVDQEVRLFSGNMRDNLTLWDDSVPFGTIQEATRDAAIDDMIEQRPGGYMARVMEAGTNMSGGERQRVDIARALARGAPVMVLDEATSALDPTVERVLIQNILDRNCTLVFISHRLAPLSLFNRIVVMQQGAIVQDGSFADLMREDGPLRQLVDV